MPLKVIGSILGLCLLLYVLFKIAGALAPVGIVIEPFWLVLITIVIIIAIIASIVSLFR